MNKPTPEQLLRSSMASAGIHQSAVNLCHQAVAGIAVGACGLTFMAARPNRKDGEKAEDAAIVAVIAGDFSDDEIKNIAQLMRAFAQDATMGTTKTGTVVTGLLAEKPQSEGEPS